MASKLGPKEIGKVAKEVRADPGKPLVVGGARELAAVLRRELGRDAAPGAVREDDDVAGAALYVHVLGGRPTEDDERALKLARRARVPIVAVVTGPLEPGAAVPNVLATDVVRVPAGQGFPVESIARAVAGRLAEDAAPLAARVPALRGAVVDQLIARFARKNGIVAAAIFIPGADLPVLTLNEIRLVLRLSQAYGLDPDPRARLPEIAAVVGAALGLRSLARQLVGLVPGVGFAVQAGIAYGATRALGEAAVKRLEAAPGDH